MPPRGEWFPDARSGERAMRVSWHAELGCVILSSWRDDACVSTVRLTTEDTAQLISVLAEGLAVAASAGTGTGSTAAQTA